MLTKLSKCLVPDILMLIVIVVKSVKLASANILPQHTDTFCEAFYSSSKISTRAYQICKLKYHYPVVEGSSYLPSNENNQHLNDSIISKIRLRRDTNPNPKNTKAEEQSKTSQAPKLAVQEVTINQNDVSEATLERVKVIFWFTIFPLFIVLGIFGNVLNLVTLFSGGLKGVAYVYIKWMAVADLSVNLLAIPWALENFVHHATDSIPGLEGRAFVTFLCRVDLVLLNGFMKSSVLLVIALTVERYIAVCHPTQYKILCTDSRAKIVVIICYVVAFIISLPLAFQYQVIPKFQPPKLLVVSPDYMGKNSSLFLVSDDSSLKLKTRVKDLKVLMENPVAGDFNVPYEVGITTTLYPLKIINDTFVGIMESKGASVKNFEIKQANATHTGGLPSSPYTNNPKNYTLKYLLPYLAPETMRYTFDTNIAVSNSIAYKIGYVWFKEIFLTFLPIVLLVFFNFRIAQDFRKIVKRRRLMQTDVKASSLVSKTKSTSTSPMPQKRSKYRTFFCPPFTNPIFKNSTTTESLRLHPERYDIDELIKTYPNLRETSIDDKLGNKNSVTFNMVSNEVWHEKQENVNDNGAKGNDDVPFIASAYDPGSKSGGWQQNHSSSMDNHDAVTRFSTTNHTSSKLDSHKGPHMKRNFRWSSFKKPDRRDSNAPMAEEDVATKNLRRQRQRQIKIKRKFQNEKRLIGLMVAVVLLFLVCILPAAIISIFFRFEKYRSRNSLRIGLIVSDTLEICNYSLNFYIYCMCSSDVRKALWQAMRCRIPSNPNNFMNKIYRSIWCCGCQADDFPGQSLQSKQSHYERAGYSEIEPTQDFDDIKATRNIPNGRTATTASPYLTSGVKGTQITKLTILESTPEIQESKKCYSLHSPENDATAPHLYSTDPPRRDIKINSSIILEHDKNREYQV